MKPAYLIILLVMNFFWAGVYCAYKVIGQEHLQTGGIVTLRFGLAGLCLLAFWPWFPGPAPRGWDLVKTCLMGVMLYALGQRLQVYGNQVGTAGNSAVLVGLDPVFTSLAAALFLHERIGPRRLGGFALGLAGVAVLNRVWRADFQWAGLGASLVFVSSFICEAAYSVLGKPIVAKASVMMMLALSLLAGTAANLLVDGPQTLAAARTLDFRAWLLLLVLAAVCTSAGYSLWFIVIRECPINVAALTIFAQSVFGVLLAALWLREQLHWGHLLGAATIVAGLVLGLSRQVRPQRKGTRV